MSTYYVMEPTKLQLYLNYQTKGMLVDFAVGQKLCKIPRVLRRHSMTYMREVRQRWGVFINIRLDQGQMVQAARKEWTN